MNAENFVPIRDLRFKILLGLLLTVIMTLGITMTASAGILINTGELWANGWKIDVQLTAGNGGSEAVFTTDWGTFSPSGYSNSTTVSADGKTASVSSKDQGNAHIYLSGYTPCNTSDGCVHVSGQFINDYDSYATTQKVVNIPTTALEMHDPVPQAVDLGVPSTIKVTVYHNGQKAWSGEKVILRINNGTGRWSDGSSFETKPTTDVYGTATATISSFAPGKANIIAYADNGQYNVECDTWVQFGNDGGGVGGHGDHTPPVANNDSYSIFQDNVLTSAAPGVLGNDTAASGYYPLTAQLISNPAHGTVSLNSDGSFIYTPSNDYRGMDSFTYRVVDNSAYSSNEAAVNITVKGPVKVIYNPTGGELSPPDATIQNKLFGSPYGKGVDGTTDNPMPTATKYGYSFNGWWTEEGAGTRVADETLVTNPVDHTLYAGWEPVQVVVTYDPQGGNIYDPVSYNYVDTQTKLYGSLYGNGINGLADPMPAADKSGYTFAGWWTTKKESGNLITDQTMVTATSAHTLYARWNPKQVKVTYDPTDGYLDPGSTTQIKLYGLTYGTGANGLADLMPIPTRTGYTFAGWWYKAGSSIKWTGYSRPVHIKDGYSLARWSKIPGIQSYRLAVSVDTDCLVTNETTVWRAQDQTLFAEWTPNDSYFTVSFDSTGGTPVEPQSIKSGDYAEEPNPAPTQSGYSFSGWYYNESLFNFGTRITGNITLYARWTKNDPGGESFPIFSATPSFFELF